MSWETNRELLGRITRLMNTWQIKAHLLAYILTESLGFSADLVKSVSVPVMPDQSQQDENGVL